MKGLSRKQEQFIFRIFLLFVVYWTIKVMVWFFVYYLGGFSILKYLGIMFVGAVVIVFIEEVRNHRRAKAESSRINES